MSPNQIYLNQIINQELLQKTTTSSQLESQGGKLSSAQGPKEESQGWDAQTMAQNAVNDLYKK